MAKTLVGLYDTLTDAEYVMHALVTEGFPYGGIRAVTSNDAARRGTDVSVGKWITAESGMDMVETLTDLGIPAAEAHAYAEGIRRGGALVIVKPIDEWTERGIEIMNRRQAVDIDERIPHWRQEGWTGMATRAGSSPAAAAPEANVRPEARPERPRTGTRVEPEEQVTIPVVEEELTVGKREVERGHVRVHTYIEEVPVEEEVRLRQERVTVERHPVDRPATEADLETFAEESMEFTETAKEPVVSRRARVVEEVTVHRDVAEHTETVRDTVRRTHVDVDQQDARSATRVAGIETYDADFRQHYTSTFASSGGAYADYEPAYRYGYTLGTEERYRGCDWSALESDARHDWEARHTGTWDRYKDAIRYGWQKVRARS
jgi:uncharacterized protein (TIGR02271 family)